MLRKLFGFLPARVFRPGRVATSPRAARAETAPHRRKPVLEALESRLLLSADPLAAVVDPQGLLALQLTDGSDTALIQRIGEAAAGGDIVAVTLGAVTQQYGDQYFGIVRLLIDAGAGDDWLRLVGITVTTEIIGGLGTNTLEWWNGDATWSITALDTGQVGTASFTSFGNLVGADDSRDTFLFAPGGGVSGTIDGGAGGLDSLVIQGGEYQDVAVTATGADSGAVALDDRMIAYGDIEPVTVAATVANLTLNATAGDDVLRLGDDPAAAGYTRLDSLSGTLPDVTFVDPTASLTVNLGAGNDRMTIGTLDSGFAAALQVSGDDGRDRIDFAGTVATHGQDLGASAEAIVVAPGSVLRTDLGAGGAVGDLALEAADSNGGALGTADASVTLDDATLIGRNITLGATASFAGDAGVVDGGSTATVEILGGEVAAAGTLTIDVRSFASAGLDPDAPSPASTPDPGAAEITLSSVATARIGGGAALAAGGDIEVNVGNAVAVNAGDEPASIAAIALESTATVEAGATLTGRDVSLQVASDATFAFADVVVAPDFASVTRAVIADEAAVRAMGVVLVSATSLSRMEHVFGGDAAAPGGAAAPGVVGGSAGMIAGAVAVEALRPDFDREPAEAPDPGLSGPIDGSSYDIASDLRLTVTERSLADAGELAAKAVAPGSGESLEDAIARELAAFEELFGDAGPKWGVAAPLVGMVLGTNGATGRAGLLPPLPAADADGDARNRQRPADTGSERDDDRDTGLGASLALSVIKESAIAELARNVTSGGAVVLSASGTPFVRTRARGGPAGDAGGALELREGEPTDAIVLVEEEVPAIPAVDERSNLAPDYRHLSATTGELVLATAARHDLIAEGSGGAEPGTAVTAATPIDVLAADASAELAADDTFTLAFLPDAAGAGGTDVHHAADGDLAGLALSTHLPALAFETFAVGDRDGPDGPIRSGDDVDALVGERAIVGSGLLDRAAFAPPAAADPAIGHDVRELVRCLDANAAGGEASAHALIGDSRQVVIAYLGALAAPIAASAGLAHPLRRRDAGAHLRGDRLRQVVPNASRYAGRASFGGHADEVRGGGAWVERFVNDLGLAAEDENPNAKIKIKV